MNLTSQYFVFLDVIFCPVSPEKIEITTPSLNKTVTLVDQGEINIPRGKGLKEITFDMLVPSFKYPFANYSFGSFSTSQIIARLEHLKAEGKPIYFIVTRCRDNKPAWWTNIKVLLEDFTVVEDANNGTDVIISINLKEYREYQTKVAVINEKADGTVEAKFDTPRSITGNTAPDVLKSIETGKTIKSITVDGGKTLYNLMKTKLGTTDINVFNALKAENQGLMNVIDDFVEINLDVKL